MNKKSRTIKSKYMTRYVLLAALLAVSFSAFAQVQTQVVGDTVLIKTNNLQRMSVWKDGTVNIAPTDTTKKPLFRFYPNGDFSSGSTNQYILNQFSGQNGLRYLKKLGILEIGSSNNIDTNMSTVGINQTTALIINSDDANSITQPIISSIIAGDNIKDSAIIAYSIISGEQHLIKAPLYKTNVFGFGHQFTNDENIGSTYLGQSHRIRHNSNTTLIAGFNNFDDDSSHYSFVTGWGNHYSGTGQLVSGISLISQGYGSAAFGIGNTEFSSLGSVGKAQPANLKSFPALVVGNSKDRGTHRSNAFTMLYNGRTQINTTGFDSTLTESQVTPKAALEVVSTTSGVLLPKLTTTQRNAIVSGDKHNGLLLYNTDSTKFQFYDGSAWRSLSDNSVQGVNMAVQSLSYSSTITWNVSNGTNSMVTLTGNAALVISNPVAGQLYRIRIKQGSGGSHLITAWPDSTLWSTGTPPTLSTTLNALDLVTFYYDGTHFYGDFKLLYQATANVSILHTDALADHEEVTHVLTGVPAGALLVITTGSESSMLDASISSSPSLTWEPRAEAEGVNSGDAEIYTAVFPTGGSINVTVNWGDNYMSSVCYTVINQEADEDGNDANATGQAAPSVNISTTRDQSILFCVTADFSAQSGASRQYRTPLPTEALYNYDVGRGTQYHYYRLAPNTGSYTVGLTDPNNMEGGTAVFEVRSR
jgi:hypothetical protein